MKTSKRQIHQLSLRLVLAACLVSASACKDTLQLQSQWKQTKSRLEQLKARGDELDRNLVDLRKVMPGGTTPQEAGRQMSMRCQADLKLLDAEITEAKTRLHDSEIMLSNLKKAIASQGP